MGCGFGGLFAARALKGAPVRVTIIDRTNHHLFQPLLYQVATGILSEGQSAGHPLRVAPDAQHSRRAGRVREIDLATRTVHADEFGQPQIIEYESLIVAGGSAPLLAMTKSATSPMA